MRWLAEHAVDPDACKVLGFQYDPDEDVTRITIETPTCTQYLTYKGPPIFREMKYTKPKDQLDYQFPADNMKEIYNQGPLLLFFSTDRLLNISTI